MLQEKVVKVDVVVVVVVEEQVKETGEKGVTSSIVTDKLT